MKKRGNKKPKVKVPISKYPGTAAEKNVEYLQHSYVHWFVELAKLPVSTPLQEVIEQLEEVELAAVYEDTDLGPVEQIKPLQRR